MDNRKLTYALIAGATFIVLSYPDVYKLTNRLTNTFGVSTSNQVGCPTKTGLALHGLVVSAMIYFLLTGQYLVPICRDVML